MRKIKYLGSIVAMLTIFFLVSSSVANRTKKIQPDGEEDLNTCLVKAKAEWGQNCLNCGTLQGYHVSYDETYKVFLTNTCDQHIDVKVCVQEEDHTWKCYHFEDMTPSDTLSAWACHGTGKYLKWIKKAGDHELVFPTNEEVEAQYTE